MLTSYHNHTLWSDGQGDLRQMIEGARQAGVDELGISDHYVLRPGDEQVAWSMPLGFLPTYVEAVQEARRESQTPIVRLGLEADYLPETIDRLRALLAQYPFDYLIGSVHYAGDFPVDEDAGLWERLSADECNAVWRLYWQRIRGLAESRVFDIVGHLDLPKLFGYRPTVDLAAEEAAALDAIAAAGMAIEINTAGWHKPVREAYPSPHLLRAACRRGIPLMVNADAHRPEHLTRGLAEGRALARAAGYSEVVRYEARRRLTEAL